jgi:hypothetical protein
MPVVHSLFVLLQHQLAAFAVVGAVAAELSKPAFAITKRFNNQQNFQGAFNFNNQQFKINLQCFGCNP